MTSHLSNYSTYLTVPPKLKNWGIYLVASGYSHVPAHANYPLNQDEHPIDHHLTWSRGRVLDALQVLHIQEGAGLLEMGSLGKWPIQSGNVFILPPGRWHRYQPNPETGWTEAWIEIKGPIPTKLLGSGELDPDRILYGNKMGAKIEAVMESIHAIARGRTTSNAELSSRALDVLARLSTSEEDGDYSQMSRVIEQAQRIFSRRYRESLNLPEIAAELGIAYSHFRREFKARIGYSPWQYVIRIRLSRVCRYLLSSDMTLEQIAELVGFNSPFHLSSQFKKVYGLSPRKWKASKIITH